MPDNRIASDSGFTVVEMLFTRSVQLKELRCP
jgi:hypothetical protein